MKIGKTSDGLVKLPKKSMMIGMGSIMSIGGKISMKGVHPIKEMRRMKVEMFAKEMIAVGLESIAAVMNLTVSRRQKCFGFMQRKNGV